MIPSRGRDTKWKKLQCVKSTDRFATCRTPTTAADVSMAKGSTKDGFEHPWFRVHQAGGAMLGAFKDEFGRASARTAWKTIGMTSEFGLIP